MSWLTKLLGLTKEANDEVAEGVAKVETTTEFFATVAEKFPDFSDQVQDIAEGLSEQTQLAKAIEASLPWTEAAIASIGEALPPVKAIVSLVKFLTAEPDPNVLGLLAFSLAYQAATADLVREIEAEKNLRARIVEGWIPKELKSALKAEKLESPAAFSTFRLSSAASHPLMRKADAALRQVAGAAGYPDDLQRLLVVKVHRRFADQLRLIVTDGKLKEKFDPLFRLLSLDSKGATTQTAIQCHIDNQLWRFEHAPTLGAEGELSLQAPLSQIFVPLDCGKLKWGDILGKAAPGQSALERASAFDEEFGGRSDMLTEVLNLIADEKLDDAIVI